MYGCSNYHIDFKKGKIASLLKNPLTYNRKDFKPKLNNINKPIMFSGYTEPENSMR